MVQRPDLGERRRRHQEPVERRRAHRRVGEHAHPEGRAQKQAVPGGRRDPDPVEVGPQRDRLLAFGERVPKMPEQVGAGGDVGGHLAHQGPEPLGPGGFGQGGGERGLPHPALAGHEQKPAVSVGDRHGEAIGTSRARGPRQALVPRLSFRKRRERGSFARCRSRSRGPSCARR